MTDAGNERDLIRAIGFKEIVALTINSIIGAGIFALPATVSGILGTASPVAFLCAGIFCVFIVLCFAELGARYDRTGGAYLYAHEAFGGAAAFVMGWMYFLARLTSVAALSSALAGFCGYFLDLSTVSRHVLSIVTLIGLGGINIQGIRTGSRVINFLTVAKLVPLILFIVAGLVLAHWNTYRHIPVPQASDFLRAVLICMFAFSGYEVIGIPGAEMTNPKRDIPLGMLLGTAITILIYLLIQLVAVAAYPDLASSERPLADAGGILMGDRGGLLMTAGAICSTVGTLTGLILTGPRILFAMAVNHQMPHPFARIHPRFRTPAFAIKLFTVGASCLVVLSNFTDLATLSAMARLVTYIGAAAALLVLRKRQPATDGFRAPAGPVIPVFTILLSLLFLSAATNQQWIYGMGALVAGFVLYAATRRRPLPRTPRP